VRIRSWCGTVTDGERFVIRPEDRHQDWRVARACADHLRAQCQALTPESQGIEVVVRPYRRRRSLAQNKCLHGWCKIIADFVEEHHGDRIMPEAWKEWFKSQVLGETEQVMPDGSVRAITKPSSKVTVEEFKELLDYMDRWAATELQLELPRTEDYWESMGRG